MTRCPTPRKRSYPTRAAAVARLRRPFPGLYCPVRVYRCRCGRVPPDRLGESRETMSDR